MSRTINITITEETLDGIFVTILNDVATANRDILTCNLRGRSKYWKDARYALEILEACNTLLTYYGKPSIDVPSKITEE